MERGEAVRIEVVGLAFDVVDRHAPISTPLLGERLLRRQLAAVAISSRS